ncbi:hypothetical protein JZO66_01130 [Enterococcus sp. DIV0242_7C1]|uniref:DUF4306 domain-containing protein n=1 Tax=Candidatus Enterococcus dunnyi TaxID=1834192 RepID=A0A200JG55_9ENTE|nr:MULTISPECIES: hypothetical protein [unclassified Enterococcus]MBO0469129.1 hypothetical protein [Enterococcus sp. DIV0242_7C1]OUZ35577.1 hypothetical protein A5889_001053 [Enterococcus sp. 9D6_DIV0238]
MINRKKIIQSLYFVLLLIWLIGVILTLNFLPMQDPDTLTLDEKINLQKQFSINYDLGHLFIKISEVPLIALTIYTIVSFLLTKYKKEKQS